MNQENTFTYKYSAKDNREVQEIRQKYLPHKESKLEEIRRLDSTVQGSGIAEALCAGIGGALVFGLGICLSLKVIGSSLLLMALGVILGIIGICGMLAAYPLYRRVFNKTREKLAPRILELTAELTGEMTEV